MHMHVSVCVCVCVCERERFKFMMQVMNTYTHFKQDIISFIHVMEDTLEFPKF